MNAFNEAAISFPHGKKRMLGSRVMVNDKPAIAFINGDCIEAFITMEELVCLMLEGPYIKCDNNTKVKYLTHQDILCEPVNESIS